MSGSTRDRLSSPPADNRRRSVLDLAAMKQRGERIAALTAYDAPSARLADAAGVDLTLVGDSAAMTVLGLDSTLPITLDEMLMLTRAVRRGTTRALVVADMPFGSYQASDDAAVQGAVRFVKEGGADAVKIEGGGPTVRRATAIVDAGIPVVGHIGLTPQSVHVLGGYKPQGRTAQAARRLLDAARSLERAGCAALVLEAIPSRVAEHITREVSVPTIGIGAGASCDGQVLVWHDVLGISDGRAPRFVKRYGEIGAVVLASLRAYVAEVRSGAFPGPEHTYEMSDGELERFERDLLTRVGGS
jgi:3-methyl-2-oxobutanoate hydroxymethyltransferase